jgi:phage-related protein
MAATIKIEINSSSGGKGIDDATRGIKELDSTARSAGGGVSSFGQIAIGALREVGAVATQGMMMAGQAIAGFVQDSVKAAGSFEAGMNTFAAASGASAEELEAFKNQFLELGKELPVSTKEVQDAATAMVKGGIDPAVVAGGALRDTLQFAAAAAMGLEEAADLTAKQLGTFVSMTASAAEKSAFMAESQELLVKAANASTLNVKELGDAMLAAGGQVKAIGMDYQDFVTTMGLISPAFGSASEAGTSFKNFLSRLAPSTKAAKDAMAELGLMGTSTTKIMEFLTANGVQPLGDDLDTLGNQFTELATSMGISMKDQDKLWSGFQQSKFFDEQTGEFLGAAAAADLLKNAMAGLSDADKIHYLQTMFGNDAMGAANALISAGSSGYDAFAAAMANANGIQGQAAATQQGFDFAMQNLNGSIEALQITIGSKLLPILTPLITQFTAGVNAVIEFASGVLGAADPVAALSAQFPILGQAITVATEAFNAIYAFVQSVMPSMMGIIQSTLTIVSALWEQHGEQWMQQARSVFTIIQGVIQVVMGVIQGILAVALGLITGDWTTAMQQISSANETIWNGIRNILMGILDNIASYFGTTADTVLTNWATGLAQLSTATTTAVTNALEALRAAIAPATEIGSAIIAGIVSGVTSAAGSLASAAAEAANAALDAAKAALGIESPSKVFAAQVGIPIAQGMAIGMQQGAPMVAGSAQSLAGSAIASATNTITNNYNYSPNYSSTPNKPSADFSMMQALARAGT